MEALLDLQRNLGLQLLVGIGDDHGRLGDGALVGDHIEEVMLGHVVAGVDVVLNVGDDLHADAEMVEVADRLRPQPPEILSEIREVPVDMDRSGFPGRQVHQHFIDLL